MQKRLEDAKGSWLGATGKLKFVTLLSSWLLFFLCFVTTGVGSLIAEALSADTMLMGTLGGAAGAVAGVVALGGISLYRLGDKPLGDALLDALRIGWWPLAISLVLCCQDLLAMCLTGCELVAEWPLRVCYVVVLCLLTGVAEESMFRGLVLGGFLNVMGKNRRGVCMAVVASALLFGMLHIEWWDMDYQNSLEVAQALLKTVQTGILGFFLAAVTIDKRSVVHASLIHGTSNFLIMVSSYGLMGVPIELEYVSTGEDAWPTVVLYLVIIALYLPMVRKGVRLLRGVEVPYWGPFRG